MRNGILNCYVEGELTIGPDRNTVDFDIERPRPFRNTCEHASRRILREITNVYRVNSVELVHLGAIDVAL